MQWYSPKPLVNSHGVGSHIISRFNIKIWWRDTLLTLCSYRPKESPSNKSNDFSLRPRLHYNAENDHRKRSHSKTLSRVERFENDAFWKRSFLVWTEKTMLSENGDVFRIDTTRRKTTRPWVSKMADRRYHVASISRQFHGPIYWNAQASTLFEHAHWGYKNVFKTDTAL